MKSFNASRRDGTDELLLSFKTVMSVILARTLRHDDVLFLPLAENCGLHDHHVRPLHAGQMPLPVLRPASHGRGSGGSHHAATATTAAATAAAHGPPGEDGRPAGAAAGRPQGAAPESLRPGNMAATSVSIWGDWGYCPLDKFILTWNMEAIVLGNNRHVQVRCNLRSP